MQNMRPRVCAAIIRSDCILMVLHHDNGREYWTLPGGGIEPGETAAEAVLREVKEETGLDAKVVRFLFAREYLDGTSISSCFLLEADPEQEAVLGFDPEELHLDIEQRMLQNVAWHPLESMKDDVQVAIVLEQLI